MLARHDAVTSRFLIIKKLVKGDKKHIDCHADISNLPGRPSVVLKRLQRFWYSQFLTTFTSGQWHTFSFIPVVIATPILALLYIAVFIYLWNFINNIHYLMFLLHFTTQNAHHADTVTHLQTQKTVSWTTCFKCLSCKFQQFLLHACGFNCGCRLCITMKTKYLCVFDVL